MPNIVNPVTNMNGWCNSLYTHYVTIIHRPEDNSNLLTAAITVQNNSASAFTLSSFIQWLKQKGFIFDFSQTPDVFRLYPGNILYKNATYPGISVNEDGNIFSFDVLNGSISIDNDVILSDIVLVN